jgi:hypothetical protein
MNIGTAYIRPRVPLKRGPPLPGPHPDVTAIIDSGSHISHSASAAARSAVCCMRLLASLRTKRLKYIPHSHRTMLRFRVNHLQHEFTKRQRNLRVPVEVEDRI